VIWAALPMPALLLDAEGTILESNPAAEQFLMTSDRSLKGQALNARLHVSMAMTSALARARANRSALVVNEVEAAALGRAPLLCTLRIVPLADTPEIILLLIEPREIADRLGRGGANRGAARAAIGMAEMLAHEIKNPLAGIAGAAQLIAMNAAPDDRALTDLIVAETRRIVKLLEQVEQFGNLRPPERRAVNIHDALDRARRSAALGFAARMTIIKDYDPSLPATLADLDQLVQVFLNLIRNAAEAAGGRAGTIRLHSFYDRALRLRRKDGSDYLLPLQVEIIDDGPGLPPGIADQIFEPFVSGRENGTGLGLALVAKIISEHDGWIAVESAPGRTVFRVSLPVAPDAPTSRKETR